MGCDRRPPRLDSGLGGGGFGLPVVVLPVPLLPELALVAVGVLLDDKSGEKRSCMEDSRCCCEAVAFVLVAFGPDVDRRPCAAGPPPRWLAVILAFSVDDDTVEEAPRNSSHEESPVDRGSSSSSSSPSLDVSPVLSGGGKRDEYDGFAFDLVLSDELSDDDEEGLEPADLFLDLALLESLERSGVEDLAEAEAEVVAADDVSSCAL
jgi:hypothetical protein